MHVEVTVHMGKPESCGGEFLELGLNLSAKVLPRFPGKLVPQARPYGVLAKVPVSVDDVGDPDMGQDGFSHHRHQVDSHGQPGMVSGNPDGVVKGRSRGHQAAAREDPVLKGSKNRPVHPFGGAEIVRIEDKLFGGFHEVSQGLGGEMGRIRRRCGWFPWGRLSGVGSLKSE